MRVPCYNTVENWMKKLGLSVYENDRKPTEKKFAAIIDENIMVNQEKLLLLLGIPADHAGHPIRHDDATVISMKAGLGFNRDDIRQEIENSIKVIGYSPEYIISDQVHNQTNGVSKPYLQHHIDISHAMGTCLKYAYGNQADFVAFITLLGKVRLQYHLTDKAYLLPLNMRNIARFMNLSSWVDWSNKMFYCFENLLDKMKEAYSFVFDNKNLLEELQAAVGTIQYVKNFRKTEDFSLATCKKYKDYIVCHVIGNASNRRVILGVEMLECFKKQEMILVDAQQNQNISSDIIKSNFGIYKEKKSPNKLYGITPLIPFIPLHAKLVNESLTKTVNFKK